MTVGDDGAGDELPGRSGLRRLLPTPGTLSRLLPAGPGGRRRIAEVGAVAGTAVVVLAFVGATVALRPSSAPTPPPDGPGLPAPAEVVGTEPGPAAPSGTSSSVVLPGRPDRTPGGTWPDLSGSPSASPTGTPTSPAPATTRASAPGPTATVPVPPTPTLSATPSPSPSATATPTTAPPTEPTVDPPPPPVEP